MKKTDVSIAKSTGISLKDYRKELKRRKPKTVAKIRARWDFKLIKDVAELTYFIADHVNPRLEKLRRKNEYLIDGPEIQHEVMKLMAKVRRITQREKKS